MNAINFSEEIFDRFEISKMNEKETVILTPE
jgi:hypothetical protein